MTKLEEELDTLVTRKTGLLMKMRTENEFDEQMFNRIIAILKEYYDTKEEEGTSDVVMLNCVYLVDALAGGSRFFDEKTTEMVEDAAMELQLFFERLVPGI